MVETILCTGYDVPRIRTVGYGCLGVVRNLVTRLPNESRITYSDPTVPNFHPDPRNSFNALVSPVYLSRPAILVLVLKTKFLFSSGEAQRKFSGLSSSYAPLT